MMTFTIRPKKRLSMRHYEPLARRFRPQNFRDVFEQTAIVQILKNAISHQRISQAYLFCGTKGTGKTTLARIFAKALNCNNLDKECEPCNQCKSCLEISAGHNLDVIEIDGASNRGIDDIRQLNEIRLRIRGRLRSREWLCCARTI